MKDDKHPFKSIFRLMNGAELKKKMDGEKKDDTAAATEEPKAE